MPVASCCECELGLWWACGFDPLPRYRKLADFAKKNGLTAEADEWRQRIELLE